MPRPSIAQIFGLHPAGTALRDAWRAIAGDPHRPPVRRGLSSARIFKPRLSIPAWLGRRRADRRVPIYNFFNRARDEDERGYSVQVTYARDFRGGRWTYDGHLGTDFVVPVGTPVAAAAPGIVLCVANHFDRGGLKVGIDHGGGLFTTTNHLSSACVGPGDKVRRGQTIGLSGASGLEFILFFPWLAPHVHFNTWLDGEPVDPFAAGAESSLWRNGSEPSPAKEGASFEDFRPTEWDESSVSSAVQSCLDPEERRRLSEIPDTPRRAAEILLAANYRPSLFDQKPRLYAERHERRPTLDLPFTDDEVSGVYLPPL
jgi:murein DD-endopeptidase